MSSTNNYIGAAVIYGLAGLATLFQIPLTIVAIIRAGSSHRLPYIVLLPTLFCLLAIYPNQIVLAVYEIQYWLIDSVAVVICVALFVALSDALFFLFVMLLVIDRLKATAAPADPKAVAATPPKAVWPLRILTFTISAVLASLGIVYTVWDTSFYIKSRGYRPNYLELLAEHDRLVTINRAVCSVYIFGTLVILISIVLLYSALKKAKRTDKIARGLFISAPFLAIRALRLLVVLILANVSTNYDDSAVKISAAALDSFVCALVIFFLIFPPILHRNVKPEPRADYRWGPPGPPVPYNTQLGPPMQQQWGGQPGFIPPQRPLTYTHNPQQTPLFPGQPGQYPQPHALPSTQQTPLQSAAVSLPQSSPPDRTHSPAPSTAVPPYSLVAGMSSDDETGTSRHDDRARIEEENAALRRRIQELEAAGKA